MEILIAKPNKREIKRNSIEKECVKKSNEEKAKVRADESEAASSCCRLLLVR